MASRPGRYARRVTRGISGPSSTLGGRYQPLEVVGAGGMATVWRALDTRLRRPVALKVLSAHLALDPGFQRRFEMEAHHVASLSHPNVVTVFDFGVDDGRAYIAMEYVPGPSLRAVLAASGPLSAVAATTLAADVLGALDHAHRRGLVHRDVKPGNMLLTPAGVVKLADFGIAKSETDTTLTAAGSLVGTAAYASPEQLAGGTVGPASDFSSLGCVLYECLAGRPPFVDADVAKVVLQQRFADPEPVTRWRPDTPPGLAAAVVRALAKDPDGRFDDAPTMARALAGDGGTTDVLLGRSALAASAAAAGGATTGPGAPRPTERPPVGLAAATRRRRWLPVAAVLVLLVVGAAVGVAVAGGGPSPTPAGGSGSMQPGDLLTPGSSLASPDGRFHLDMLADGNLVTVPPSGVATWESATEGHRGAYAVMQSDGDFVIYPAGVSAPLPGQPTRALWSSGTSGNAGASVILENDGDLVVRSYQGDRVLWTSKGTLGDVGSELLAGDQLRPGQYLQSPDGRYRLVAAGDQGVLNLETSSGCILWGAPAVPDPEAYAVMQPDGNLVVYGPSGGVLWQAGTSGNPGASLLLEDNGYLPVSSARGSTLWHAPTGSPVCPGT